MEKAEYTKEFFDPESNQMVTMSVVKTDAARAHAEERRNFYIAYMDNLMKLCEALGGKRGKKYKVFDFIIKNMDREQKLVMTTTEMAEKLGVSRKTVTETLKALKNAGLIVRKTGAVMVNPKLFNNRSAAGEESLYAKYKQFNPGKPGETQEGPR